MNFASMHNYYERLVFDYINQQLIDQYEDMDEEFFLDVACYSLSKLPARYIRHEIDMMFFLTPEEEEKMDLMVSETIQSAAQFIYGKIKQAGVA
jgi:competence protein ComFB